MSSKPRRAWSSVPCSSRLYRQEYAIPVSQGRYLSLRRSATREGRIKTIRARFNAHFCGKNIVFFYPAEKLAYLRLICCRDVELRLDGRQCALEICGHVMLGSPCKNRIVKYLPDVLKDVLCRGSMPFTLHWIYHSKNIRDFQMRDRLLPSLWKGVSLQSQEYVIPVCSERRDVFVSCHSIARFSKVSRWAIILAAFSCAGRSAAVARLLWEQDVAGSIPVAPTIYDRACDLHALFFG